eukprot:CAMPEP_0204616172 /NCGR_PEP_ID=MMETSP0717-20131115/3474_1 /ASSEMBLY_ACC=CAM_ASM_000666 /TAXON_ID=230516 /ORGANISM="Chaetoceros curvisetus" /LENGTH=396 /DNA_ID=CAMNT_0051629321 /DNA_START=156 /DNA_END=1346 /DNA_ORIENTATION=+
MDERLQSHLREKMAAKEEAAANAAAPKNGNGNGSGANINNNRPQHFQLDTAPEGMTFDLEGVTCEPAIQTGPTPISMDGSIPPEDDAHTLWNFHVDGATYPARLTNLPCPVELHKTHDHAMYYKCRDVAQMLIVYEDMTALEEAESMTGYKVDGFPSYFHSGLTPPMTKVVSRRFKQREHASVPPPVEEIQEVESFLIELIKSISTKDPTKKAGRGSASISTKVLEEVEDEVVDYEPWMDNYGKEPSGMEFSERDAICKSHPELWLDAEENKADEASLPSVSKESSTSQANKKSSKSNKISTSGKTTPSTSTTKEKKKKSKKKKKTTEDKTSSAPAPAPASSRPKSTEPISNAKSPSPDFDLLGDSLNNGQETKLDGFDFDLENLGDFDLEELDGL